MSTRSSFVEPIYCIIAFPNSSSESDAEERATHRAVLFRQKVDAGAAACARGDFDNALRLYDETIRLDPTNHVLYSNRSAIYCKLNRFEDALRDAERAYDLKPIWFKAYFRKGYALKSMGEHIKALLAYANGLTKDSKNGQLLNGLIDCVKISFLKERFEIVYEELCDLGLERSSFVLISVIGQELLSAGYSQEAVQILECALKVGTTSLKLRQSVLSSLSSAYWQLGQLEKGADFMKQDLAVATSLGDSTGEARAHSNLGMVYLSLGKETEALNHYRHHLILSLKTGDQRACVTVLPLLGQLYLTLFDYDNSLSSYQQCLEMLHAMSPDETDPMETGQQLHGMGQVYSAKGEYQSAEECFRRYLTMAQKHKSVVDQTKAQTALGRTLQKQQRFNEAANLFKEALKLSKQSQDKVQEGILCGLLSSVCQSQGAWQGAKRWAERQLQVALELKDPGVEGSACGNLGSVFQKSADYENAFRLHSKHHQLAETAGDKRGILLALRNMGCCLALMGDTEKALEAHRKELALARELHDRAAESLAHGSLASLFVKTEDNEQTLTHLKCHWNLAKDSSDVESQLQALSNMGEYLIKTGQYQESIEFLDKYLMLAQEHGHLEAEQNACLQLGKAHFATGGYREASRYFDQQLAISKDIRNYHAMTEAYKCLGDTNAALGLLDEAMEMYKYYLALAHISSDVSGKLQAMTQLGSVLIQKGDAASAVKVLGKGLKLAKASKDMQAEGQIYGYLGDAYSLARRNDKSLAFYSQELGIFEQLSDMKGRYNAYGHIGHHFKRQKQINNAVKAFEDQAEVGRQMKNIEMESEALLQIGSTCAEFSLVEDAMKSYDETLRILKKEDSDNNPRILKLILNTLRNLSDSQENLNLPLEAVRTLEHYVLLETERNSGQDGTGLAVAYKKLGLLWLKMKNFSESISNYDLALNLMENVIIDTSVKIDTFRGLAAVMCAQECYADAEEILEKRLEFVRRINLFPEEPQALFDLGCVYALQQRTDLAVELFQRDLELCKRENDWLGICRASAQLLVVMRSGQDLRRHLVDISSQPGASPSDILARIEAHQLLGISFIKVCEYNSAVTHFEQALGLAASLNRLDVEIEIRIARAVTFWSIDKIQDALKETEVALRLAETTKNNDLESDILKLGYMPELLSAICVLQTCILAERNIEDALVSCEKWRYWQLISSGEQYGGQLRRERNNYPTTDRLRMTIRQILSLNNTIISQMQLSDQLLFTWIATQSKGLNLIITRAQTKPKSMSDENSLIPNQFEWKLSSPDLISVLDNRLDLISGVVARKGDLNSALSPLIGPQEMNNLVFIGHPSHIDQLKLPKTAKIRYLPALSIPNIRPKSLPSHFLIPGFVCGFSGCKGLDNIAKILSVERNLAENIDKSLFLSKMSKSRCVHLALKSENGNFILKKPNTEEEENEFLLFLDDFINSNYNGTLATLMVDDYVNINSFINLSVVLMISGFQSVVIGPNNEFFEAFYKELLMNGKTPLEAVASIKPSLRNGEVKVFGSDSKLPEKGSDMSRALRALLQTPDECREALRVILHLVEKSLQRIHTGQLQTMYTSGQSVLNKVGPEVCGWLDFLEAVGFQKKSNDKDSMLHFPNASHVVILTNASKVLQNMLGLPQNSLISFCQLIDDVDAAGRILQMLECLSNQLTQTSATQFETLIGKDLYDKVGVHGLVASLGFDKLREDQTGVTVKTIRMELTRRKVDQAIVCLHALFYDCLIDYSPSDSELKPVSTKPSSVLLESELTRLKDLEITDLSGIDTDVCPDFISKTSSKRKPNGFKRSRGRKPQISGYGSESEIKHSKKNLVSKGYFSEDENRRNITKIGERSISGEILETTARVLSVDERGSPYSDLGDSCIEDDVITTPIRVHYTPSSVPHSHSRPLSPANPSAIRTPFGTTPPSVHAPSIPTHTPSSIPPSIHHTPIPPSAAPLRPMIPEYVRTGPFVDRVYSQRLPTSRPPQSDYCQIVATRRPPPPYPGPPRMNYYSPPRTRAPLPPVNVRQQYGSGNSIIFDEPISNDADLLRNTANKMLSPKFGFQNTNYAQIVQNGNNHIQASFI